MKKSKKNKAKDTKANANQDVQMNQEGEKIDNQQ